MNLLNDSFLAFSNRQPEIQKSFYYTELFLRSHLTTYSINAKIEENREDYSKINLCERSYYIYSLFYFSYSS